MTGKRIQRSQQDIRQAGVNRSTFYAHYLDKYDLLDKLEDELLNELEMLMNNPGDMSPEHYAETVRKHSERMLSVLYEHREFFRIATDSELNTSFMKKACRLIDRI